MSPNYTQEKLKVKLEYFDVARMLEAGSGTQEFRSLAVGPVLSQYSNL